MKYSLIEKAIVKIKIQMYLDEENTLILKSKNFLAKGKFEEAYFFLKTALAISPYNKEIYHLISETNKNMKKFDEAKLFDNIYELFNNAHI